MNIKTRRREDEENIRSWIKWGTAKTFKLIVSLAVTALNGAHLSVKGNMKYRIYRQFRITCQYLTNKFIYLKNGPLVRHSGNQVETDDTGKKPEKNIIKTHDKMKQINYFYFVVY